MLAILPPLLLIRGENVFGKILDTRIQRCLRGGGMFHRRKMSAHALLKMTCDLFRAMSLALRQKCPRNVVEMKEAMAAFFWQ